MTRVEIEPFAMCPKDGKYVEWGYCLTKCPFYHGETGNYDYFECSYKEER